MDEYTRLSVPYIVISIGLEPPWEPGSVSRSLPRLRLGESCCDLHNADHIRTDDLSGRAKHTKDSTSNENRPKLVY